MAGNMAGILPANAMVGLQQKQAEEQAQNPLVPTAETQAPAAQIATDPAATQENTSRWAQILEKLQEPNVQQALLTFGAVAGQPRGPNDSHLGRITAGAAAGGKRFTELEQQDKVNVRRDAGVKTAEDRTAIAQDQLKIQQDRDKRDADANAPEGIDTRLKEAQIANYGEKALGTKGSQQQMVEGLADRLVKTGQFDDPNQAYLKAFEMAKSTGGKTREQATLDIASDLYQLKLNPTPDDLVQAAQDARDMVQLIMPAQGSAAGGAANASAPAQPQATDVPVPPNMPAGARTPSPASVAALRANESDPNIVQQFDQAFWPGAAQFYLQSGGAIQR